MDSQVSALANETEKAEQMGFINLRKRQFDTFRNPTAHSVKTSWPIGEADAFDLMSPVSYTHRWIDNARKPGEVNA